MPLAAIPAGWCKAVCAILKTEDLRFIDWTKDARQRFDSDYVPHWQYEVYPAFRAYLSSQNPVGCPITMSPTSETWEFLFPFLGTTAYGKIALRADRKSVVVFSAHKALKTKLSCELI